MILSIVLNFYFCNDYMSASLVDFIVRHDSAIQLVVLVVNALMVMPHSIYTIMLYQPVWI